MDKPNLLVIAQAFSATPGPRYIHEGDFSGQLFRRTVLASAVKKAIAEKSPMLIDLDGTSGYGTSFLEEAFGGLIREENLQYDDIKKYISLKSDEEDYLLTDIEEYLEDARKEKLGESRK